MSKVRYVPWQSNTAYLAHEVHILFFTTKQTSQTSHASDNHFNELREISERK